MGMASDGDPSASQTFAPEAESVMRARHMVWQLLESWSTDRRISVDPGVAGLLVSELVTNAIKHAGTPVEVAVRSAGVVRVEVTDERADLPIAVTESDELAVSGRGLMLVDQLASRWGYRRTPGSKTIWFELDPLSGA